MTVSWGSGQARGVLTATILGSGLAMLDGTIINIALPRIGAELGTSVSGLQWILDGYLLALASLILIAGSLGDRYGRRRVFVLGVVWFAAASVAAAAAVSTPMLVATRVLQGVGGALLTPGSLAILETTFAREDRARAIGAWSGYGGIATAIGPLVGGLLVQVWSWRLAFLINVPIAAVCVWFARRYVPDTRDELGGGRPRVLSSALGALGLAGITAALVEAPVHGIASPLVLVTAALGVAGLIVFVRAQFASADPLVPPSLFRDRSFTLSNGLTFVVYAALSGVMLLLVLQLQVSLGYSPTVAGLASLPVTLLMLLGSGRSGALAQRFGPRLQLLVGPLVLAAGMLLMMRIAPGVSYVGVVLPGVVVFGIGLTIVVAPVTATVLAAAPERNAGVASGVNNAIARAGGLLAIAILPAISGLSGEAYANPDELTVAWRISLVVCAGLAVLGGLLGAGVRNDVLYTRPVGAKAPGAPECLHCAVTSPPTQLGDYEANARVARRE